MKCEVKGCEETEVCTPTVKLWAKGYPRSSHCPAEVQVGLWICEAHRDKFVADVKAGAFTKIWPANKVEPDLEDFEVEWGCPN